jgi:hypothetical protein
MAKGCFETRKFVMMREVGEDPSLIVHLIASNFGASDCLPEDLSDLVIKHLTTYHYYVYPSRLFSSFFGYRTGTEDHLEEIVGRFDDSPFQAALPPGHMAGTRRQKLGKPYYESRTKQTASLHIIIQINLPC